MVKKSDFFLIIILFCFGVFFVYLYFYIESTQKDIKEKIITEKINHIKYVLENIENDIVTKSNGQDLLEYFDKKEYRDIFEERLSQMITKNTKYIYLLYLDKNNKFRFLLDGSKEDKARYYQKFDPLKPEVYNTIYTTQEPYVVWQKNMENLWITYLYPIKQNNKVLGILSVDLTTNLQKNVLELMEPLKKFFIVLIIFIFLLISLGTIHLFKYFTTRKRLFHDQLTNIFNRNYLAEILPTLNLNNYSIAMLDLDRFKVINDTYGHKAGDFVLQKSAKIFKDNIRDSDILIRYGGEEFLLFINKRAEEEVPLMVSNRIRKKMADTIFNYDDIDIAMTVSIGLHESPVLEKNFTEAIKKADSMLYKAKQRGRNQVVVYDEKINTSLTQNRKSIDEIKYALEQNRIICHYQPIVEAKTKKIFKYEALVRIISETGDIIYPGSFLPHLKHTNIHYKLTIRILTICFNAFRDNNLKVSINLSFLDFMNNDINNFIIDELEQNRDLASRISFEILESDEIEDISLFTEKINKIHSLGVKISIDDFGSGYSNFKAVLDIDANFLKIDGTLIEEINKDEKNFMVVKNIVQFAKDTNMKTIAEFVSSKEIHDKLLTIDIDYMQGFYLAKPTEKIIVDLQ